MYHFFAEPSDIRDRDIYIRGGDCNHIKNVLRMKKGDTLSVSDGVSEREYRVHIEELNDDEIHCRLDFIKEEGNELPVKVTLFQCLPKSDKMELIIQKAVELGVYEVVPVASKRCVVKLDAKKAAAKISRWSAISESAAKQSKRSVVPEVKDVMSFDEALSYAKDMDVRLIPYELAEDFSKTAELLSGLQDEVRVAVFIGPEGGFEEEEIERAKEAGVVPVTLGRRILRTETAAMVLLSWLVYLYEK